MNIRKFIAISFFLFSFSYLYAGDDPCSATMLDTDAPGITTFDNTGNTDSGIDPPPYGDYEGPDTWLSFIMPDNGELPMIISGGTMDNPAIAIYSGDCSEPKLLYNVIDNNCDPENNYPAIFFDELTPGEEYFIRVWAQSGSSNGDFNISFDTSVDEPVYLLYGDAYEIGDGCIQLTEDQNNQHGCAWNEEEVDFSQAFSDVMTANFGDKDATGADGICLVYQMNGSDYCGSTGEGIGAGGMPNSVIIEFDTWQNTNLNDPVLDHCAININGNMNHNSSINGPVTLGNIEDGADHEIEFNWDPSTNKYFVKFDGNIILAGVYDFINNVFGGETLVWGGYTAATGGANNDQIICPNITDPIVLGTQEHIDTTICEGEDYNGYTESGFYIEYVQGQDTCSHQINISLEVIPESEPVNIYDTICEGYVYYYEGEAYYETGNYEVWLNTDFGCDSLVILNLEVIPESEPVVFIDTMCVNGTYEYDGEIFTEPGSYDIWLETDFGCDSIVILDLRVVDMNLEILKADTLNCKTDTVDLKTKIENSGNFEIIYNWNGPSGIHNGKTWRVTKPGTYYLTADVSINDSTICPLTDSVFVFKDTILPFLPKIEDIIFECDQEIDSVIFSIDSNENDVLYTWFFNDSIISDSSFIKVQETGTYIIEAYDSISGCINIDSVSLLHIGGIPNVTTKDDTITCGIKTIIPYIETSDDVTDYIWYLNGDSISNIKSPVFDTPGLYEVLVTNNDGCTNSSMFTIFLNNDPPVVNYEDVTIPCNKDSIDILAEGQNLMQYNFNWLSPDGQNSKTENLTAFEKGDYLVTVTDPSNNCEIYDTIYVNDLGDSPVADINPEILNCNNTGYNIEVVVDSINADFNWELNNTFFSDIKNPFIDTPGNYNVTITSSAGCENFYSIVVNQNLDTISVEIENPEKLTCSQINVTLNVNTSSDVDDYLWTGPNGYTSTDKNPVVSTAGKYELSIINPETGCTSSTWVIVENDGSFPEFILEGDTLDCSTDQVEINIITDETYQSIEWSGPEGFKASGSKKISVTKPGNYEVNVINEYGCEKSEMIEIKDITLYPEVMLLSDDSIFYELNTPYDIETKIITDEENIVSIQWNPPTFLSCSDCLDPVFLSDKKQNINYSLTIANKQGCEETIYVYAGYLEKEKPVIISAPNIIFCDQNISNKSIFTIYGHPVELISEIKTLKIFDRWGELVFEKTRLPINEYRMGWDGSFKGKHAMEGVYVYYAEVLLVSGEIVKIFGDVTLIR